MSQMPVTHSEKLRFLKTLVCSSYDPLCHMIPGSKTLMASYISGPEQKNICDKSESSTSVMTSVLLSLF